MPAEETQWQGREGVLAVKRWLEHTVRFLLPYDVYTNATRTTLKTYDGEKRFDLRGDHYDERFENPQEIYIEVKNYTTDQGLAGEFIDFVANAYSATQCEWDRMGQDPGWHFMFASTHAWSSTKYWQLTELESLREACAKRPHLMLPEGADEERLRILSQRLFVWVISRRQEDMTMGSGFRGDIFNIIGKRGVDG